MPQPVSQQLGTETKVAQTKASRRRIIRELVIEDGRIDILAEYILGYPPQSFHREMLDWQDAHQEGLMLAWRGAAKTTFLTISRAIFEIIRDPNIRILIAADAQDQAKTILRSIKAHLEGARFQEVFGDLVTGAKVWTESEITVNRRTSFAGEPTVMCSGIGTTLPSRHFDMILADDLVTEDNSGTEGQRTKTHNYFYKTLLPTLMSPHGRLWIIGTRWHEEDLYGWLQREDYQDATFVMSALDEETETSRWESNFPTSRLLRIRKGNPVAFELQYQCRGTVGDGGLFLPVHFVRYDTSPRDYYKWQGVDLAVGQKEHNDFFAHVTIAVEKVTKEVYLMEFRKQKIPFPRQTWFIHDRFRAHPETVRVVVETNAFQLALKQQLTVDYPEVPVVGRYTLKDKVARAQQLAAVFTNRPLHVLPQHHEFVRLMLSFPHAKGSKDLFDALDLAMSQGLKGARKPRNNEPGLI